MHIRSQVTTCHNKMGFTCLKTRQGWNAIWISLISFEVLDVVCLHYFPNKSKGTFCMLCFRSVIGVVAYLFRETFLLNPIAGTFIRGAKC